MPLEKQMWGDEFGQLTDRYGIAWMVNITQAA
jgi:PhnB protein